MEGFLNFKFFEKRKENSFKKTNCVFFRKFMKSYIKLILNSIVINLNVTCEATPPPPPKNVSKIND